MSSHHVADVKKPKSLCVHVEQRDGESVDVRLPFLLIRAGVKLSALLPTLDASQLAKEGLDLSQLSALSEPELIEVLREGVTVSTSKGQRITLTCE